MLKELQKDCIYIAKVLNQQFQFLTFLKITFFPALLVLATWIASKFSLEIPSFTWKYVSFILLILCVLFTIARKARKLEEPNLRILFEPNNNDFVIESPSLIYVRVLPIVDIFIECRAVVNKIDSFIDGKWQSTGYSESLRLRWSNQRNYEFITLHKDVRQFLDILTINADSSEKPRVNLSVDRVSPNMEKIIENGDFFRFHIFFINKGPIISSILELDLRNGWSAANLKVVN